MTDSGEDERLRLEMALRRRLERMREPQVFHPIEPKVETGYPEPDKRTGLPAADVAQRAVRRVSFQRELARRIAKRIETGQLSPHAAVPPPPPGMIKSGSSRKPTDFRGVPAVGREAAADQAPPRPAQVIKLGDSIAARARKLKKAP